MTKHQHPQDILKKLSSVVEQTADNVFITNCEGVIEYVNAAFEQLTGYSRAEAIGQTPRFLKSGQHDVGKPEFGSHNWHWRAPEAMRPIRL